MRPLIATVALCAALCPVTSAAQDTSSPAETLPSALVTALSGRGYSEPTYYVNSLPPEWPSLPLPREARVLGGMKSRVESIAIFEDTMPHALAAFDSAFEAAGFRHPTPDPLPGFQGNPITLSYFCRDSASVSATMLPAGGRQYVSVRYVKSGRFTGCAAPRATRPKVSNLVLPLLQPPPGAKTPGGASQLGQDELSAYAQLEAPKLSSAQVLEHYAKQLASAGWTPAPAAVSGRAAVQPFDARDDKGGEWSGALFATSDAGVHQVSLQMRRVKK